MITLKDIVLEGHPALRKRAESYSLTEEQQELAKETEFLHNSQKPEIAEKYELRRKSWSSAAPQLVNPFK